MSSLTKYKSPFIENEVYHVYNRTNNKEILFNNNPDYQDFLTRYYHYSSPFLDTFSYNLLPTHFHLLARIKSFGEIKHYLENKPHTELSLTEKGFLKQSLSIHDVIENVFQRFFISYTMCFNNAYCQKGNLLHRSFKHIRMETNEQFTQSVIYINANAVKHKLVKDFRKYK